MNEYSFKRNNPKNKEEKLIIELCDNLHECTNAYINLNKASCNDHEIFITLRDGCISFCAETIQILLKVIAHENQKKSFVKECQNIFNNYIKQMLGSS